MALKRKISVRKILQVMLTVVVSVGCIIAMVSASGIESNKTVASVEVHIKNDKKYHFIEQNEILDLAINNRNVDVQHLPLSKLDIHSMEQVILADPWVATTQVYVDNMRVLQIYVTQRIPVMRVFQQNGASFYLDSTLSAMPLSDNYKYYTTVVTNVPELKNDSASSALKKQLLSLVTTIQADSFWNTQVSHVVIDSDATFELIPLLGNQRIMLGDASQVKEKLDNLFAFYKKVLNRIGWDKYETLDVRFNGQVIASPSLPYKGPVDKVVDKMNWINSIVETEARNDSKDSVHAADTRPVQKETGKEKVSPKQDNKHVVQAAKGKLVQKAAKNTIKKGKDKLNKKQADKANKQKTKGKTNKAKDKKDRKKVKPKYVYPDKK
jgi:cell division protein FtsQ